MLLLLGLALYRLYDLVLSVSDRYRKCLCVWGKLFLWEVLRELSSRFCHSAQHYSQGRIQDLWKGGGAQRLPRAPQARRFLEGPV